MEANLKIFSDEPLEIVKKASFGFDRYNTTLSSAILYADTPITFGIFGNWGTGKTSLMRMVYNNLLEHSSPLHPTISVWFDAWRYEQEPNLLIPMLYTIRDEIQVQYLERNRSEVLVQLVTFLDKFICSLAVGLEVNLTTSVGGVTYKAKDSIEAAKAITKQKTGPFGSSVFFDMFHYLREALRGLQPKLRIIIFIDDLDRCVPEKALQVLEVIKLIMSIDGIVFVIGADREVLERAVLSKFDNTFHIDGNAFIKKMFQVIFSLPPLRQEDILRFIEGLLAETKCIDEKQIGTVSRIILHAAGNNPREVKRLINSFMIMTGLGAEESMPEIRALFLILQQKWPDVYQKISNNKSKFIELCHWMQGQADAPKKKLETSLEQGFIKDLSIDLGLLQLFQSILPNLNFTESNELDPYIYSASIASAQLLYPHELKFHHDFGPYINNDGTNSGQYKWKIYPIASDTTFDRIDKIIYRLPPSTYHDDERPSTRANNFLIDGVGNINVPVKITVFFKSGQSVERTYELDFSNIDNKGGKSAKKATQGRSY